MGLIPQRGPLISVRVVYPEILLNLEVVERDQGIHDLLIDKVVLDVGQCPRPSIEINNMSCIETSRDVPGYVAARNGPDRLEGDQSRLQGLLY